MLRHPPKIGRPHSPGLFFGTTVKRFQPCVQSLNSLHHQLRYPFELRALMSVCRRVGLIAHEFIARGGICFCGHCADK